MLKPMSPNIRIHPHLNQKSTAFARNARLAGFGLMAVACGVFLTACGRSPSGAATPPAVEVATVTIVAQRVVLTAELPGRTSPYRVAEIRPQVNGLIQKRLFTEGSDVQAGQELYQIDPAPFQAALDTAQAALGRVEANLPAIRARAERFKELLGAKAVSQQNYDEASAALSQAEAELRYYQATLESARINLNYARVVSPISGRIGASTVTDGAIVTAYQPMALATIQQLDPIYVDVPQSTAELLRLQRRMEAGGFTRDAAGANQVQLLLGDGTKYSSEGTLQFRDISVDPSTASVILRAVFPNPKGILLPGMFVRAEVKEGVSEQAILVPQQGVSRDTKGNPVALVVGAGSKIEQRLLAVGRAIGDRWLVTAGLTPGDRVVVEGMQKVRPGVTVKEVPFADGKTAAAQSAPTSK